jgi:hypothetical protein
VHYGIVEYDTDSKDISQTARLPIRIDRIHPGTTFRVGVTGLTPQTTY